MQGLSHQASQQGGGFFDAISDTASSTAGKVALGFNALTTGMGINEMHGGANSSMAKTMEGTMSNISSMFGAKQLGEHAGHFMAKKLPVVGLGMGLYGAADRAMGGDFAGAGMELASGALSMVPGAGTVASAGVDLTLMARDANSSHQDPGKGGIFDQTTSLSGMQNLAYQQAQEQRTRELQGESYNISGQVEGIKSFFADMLKSPPNVSNEDVAKLQRDQRFLKSQVNR